MTRVVVLGLDALDIELAEEFGVAEQFGAHRRKLDTWINPATDEPHTKELWPSMISGLHPDDHGIHAVSEGDGGVEWAHPLLNTASALANGIVPKPVLNAIGARLRERGAALEGYSTDYYDENEIQTVFDGVEALPISIPNYETAHDRQLGLDANRDDVWAELAVDRSGEGTDFAPGIDMSAVHDILGREMGRRTSLAIHGIADGYPLVWVWYGVLDTVGHMAPAVDAPLERHYYELAASQTAAIRALAPDDAIILAVSDHGIQEGQHTHHATLCSDGPEPVDEIGHVFELADWLDAQTIEGHAGGRVDADELKTANKRLGDLGYI